MIKKTLRALMLSACLAVAPVSHGSATLTNYSDLWWTPSESGWGANITQQADLMFVTLYVYGVNGQPTWFTALLLAQPPAGDGATVFSGTMFQSSGPYFGGSFHISPVVTNSVGTATFRATSTTHATLTYSVGGVVVHKEVERLPLRADNFSGSYIGASSDITSDCTLQHRNGIVTEETGPFTVTHVGTVMQIAGPVCTYSGNFSQLGQVSRMEGSYTCTNGASGSVTFFDLRVEPAGITGRYFGGDTFCEFTGNLGLARRK